MTSTGHAGPSAHKGSGVRVAAYNYGAVCGGKAADFWVEGGKSTSRNTPLPPMESAGKTGKARREKAEGPRPKRADRSGIRSG
eukprot:1194138-Pleurochrysis_carterae.AAC.1